MGQRELGAMRKALLSSLILAALVLAPVQAQPEFPEAQRNLMLRWCRENLAQQHTPGYKAWVTSYFVGAQPDLDTTQGRVVATGIPLHLAILGEGFFVLQGDQFTRDGRMQLRDDLIRSSQGIPLLAYKLDEQGNIAQELGTIAFPIDPSNQLYLGRYNEFSFDAMGNFLGGISQVDAVTGHMHTEFFPLYRLPIATFAQPHRLMRQASGTLIAGPESGPFRLGLPAQQRVGFLIPRSLELSNVDPVQQAYTWGRLDASEVRPLPKPRPKK